MQGFESVYLVHFPIFQIAKHRRQLILAVNLSPKAKESYISIKKGNPNEHITFVTSKSQSRGYGCEWRHCLGINHE